MNDQQELKGHLVPEQPLDYCEKKYTYKKQLQSESLDLPARKVEQIEKQATHCHAVWVAVALVMGLAIGFSFGVVR